MANKKDFATSVVATAPSPADSGTSLVVTAGHGARFPTAPFYIVAHPPSEMPTLDNAEKILVTAKSTDTFTLDRQEGDPTAKSIEVGWRVSNVLFLDDIPDTFDDLTDGSTNKAFTSTLKTKLDGIEALADVTDAANVDAAGATMNTDTNIKPNSWVLDQDNMSGNDDTKVPTQQSVKAYVDAAITAAKSALLPVGSIVVLGVSTNPNTLYGFGTWTAIEGRVIVGKAASGTFNTLDATGGEETHTLTTAEIPSHDHDTGIDFGSAAGGSYQALDRMGGAANDKRTGFTGGDGAHNNLQPYIVKYMWQRTA